MPSPPKKINSSYDGKMSHWSGTQTTGTLVPVYAVIRPITRDPYNTERRQVSWLADRHIPQYLPGFPVASCIKRILAAYYPLTVTSSHRSCTCFPFTLIHHLI